VSEFVEPSDTHRLAALRGLTDAALVGHYWRLEDLDGLTDDERRRLKRYRHDTFGFEEYCETLVAGSDREHGDGADLTTVPPADPTAVLDRWEAAFLALNRWHHERSVPDGERNPVAKVLIYEESRITGVRGRLCPRVGDVDQHADALVIQSHPRPPAGRGRPKRGRFTRVEQGADEHRVEQPRVGKSTAVDAGPDAGALTDAILVLAEAVDRLADVIAKRPGLRTPPEPRSGRSSAINAGVPKGN